MESVTVKYATYTGVYPNARFVGNVTVTLENVTYKRTLGNRKGGRETETIVGTVVSVAADKGAIAPKVGERITKRSFDWVSERLDAETKVTGYTRAAETFAKLARENGLTVSDYVDHSRISESKYLMVNGFKVRFSSHDLPGHHNQPDLDIRGRSAGRMKQELDRLLEMIDESTPIEEQAVKAFEMYDSTIGSNQ